MIAWATDLRRVEAERDKALREAEYLADQRRRERETALRQSDSLSQASAEIADLRARLAKWEEPKPRGPGGRFLGKREQPA